MENVADCSITIECTIRDAIETIDRGAVQIALVVDEHQHLLGTLTDGDVRRGLLRGEALDSPVERVMNRSFRSLPVDATEHEALALMRRETLHQVPVLDEHGRIVQLYLLEDLLRRESLPNTVVLMAGGEGRRLRPLTEDCPKPMLPVGGKPLLEIILEQCIDAGFEQYYISVNYLRNHVKDYFRDGTPWGIRIHYLEEEEPLGTAGALSLLPERPTNPILVINGDVLTRVNFSRLLHFHMENQAVATVAVREHLTEIPYGVIHIDGEQVHHIEEKPVMNHHITAGIYMLDPDVLDWVSPNEFLDMPDLIAQVIKNGQCVVAFPIHEYWRDVGHPETLERANGEWE